MIYVNKFLCPDHFFSLQSNLLLLHVHSLHVKIRSLFVWCLCVGGPTGIYQILRKGVSQPLWYKFYLSFLVPAQDLEAMNEIQAIIETHEESQGKQCNINHCSQQIIFQVRKGCLLSQDASIHLEQVKRQGGTTRKPTTLHSCALYLQDAV